MTQPKVSSTPTAERQIARTERAQRKRVPGGNPDKHSLSSVAAFEPGVAHREDQRYVVAWIVVAQAGAGKMAERAFEK